MGEKLKGFGTKALETVKTITKKVSKKVWILSAAALILIAAVVTIVLYNRPYSVLFTGLSADEASTIMSYLEENGATDYRLENNDTILVPKNQADQLKAKLLMEGYPKSGFAYSTYYDNISALSTEAERNKAALDDLQDRMAATIRCMDGVKDATVTINQGEDRSYVLDSGNVVEASAFAMVTMKDGAALSSRMADAIRTLISHGVKGLEISNVSIVDSLGNTYSAASGDSAADSDASDLKLRLEEEYNNKIRTEVLQALTPFFGADNVKVGVSCTVDVSYTTQDSTDVRLPSWAEDGSTNGAGIIGSRVYSATLDADEDTMAGGVVGTTSNADLPTYVEQDPDIDGTETRLQVSGQIDYNNSQDQTHTVRTAGYLTDCTISVSINSTTAGAVNVDSIREHVANAAGITAVASKTMTAEEYLANKISVLSLPFYEPTVTILSGPGITLPDWLPAWALYAALGGLLLFIILLIVILRIAKKRKQKKLAAAALAAGADAADVDAMLAAAAAEAATGADVMSMQTEHSMALRKDIRRFADENPELAAQMIKSWLRGGDDNG